MLFEQIQDDLYKQHSHISGQIKLIDDQIDAFKNLAMVYQVYYRAQSIIGNPNFAILSGQDEESGNSSGI